MKKLLSILLAMTLTLGLLPARAARTPETPPADPAPAELAEDTSEWFTVDGVVGGKIRFDSGTGAIIGCETTVTEADIPAFINGTAVTSIGEYAFSNCSDLTSVTIPEGVTTIDGDAFSDCFYLTSVTIPESVTYIGGNAFYACSRLTSANIPKNITSIGYRAFAKCSLDSVTIPGSVTYMGEYAFYGCSLSAAGPIGSGCDLEFGWTDKIPTDAFSGCGSLRSVTLPEGVTSIGAGAFKYCERLTDLNIPQSVTFIGRMAFYESGLINITIPGSVTSIGDNMFYGCFDMTGITLSEGVTSIGDNAFYGCANLKSIVIPEGVTTIGNYAFHGCTDLQDVAIPKSVTSIGDYAFEDCSSLTSVAIPEGVTAIGDWTFYGCRRLTGVAIPGSVTRIGRNVFTFMGLTDVYYAGSEAQWQAVTVGEFNDKLTSATIHYNTTHADMSGTLRGDESLRWTYIGDTLELERPLPQGHMILVACYDWLGRFTGVKRIDGDRTAVRIGAPTAFRLFWLDGSLSPRCESELTPVVL